MYFISRSSFSLFSLSGIFLFGLLAIGAGVFSFSGNAQADSIASETAFRAADTVSRRLSEKIPLSSNSTISDLAVSGESCSGGVLRGEGAFGKYSVIFRDDSDAALSCSERVSGIAFLEATGIFGGESRTIGVRILPQVSQEGLRCAGSLPNHAVAYSGDSTGLSGALLWAFSSTDTVRKCEYSCASGYEWGGSSCVASGSGSYPIDGECGAAAKGYAEGATAFSGLFCVSGVPSPSTIAFPSPGESATWKCLGSDGGEDSSSCVATRMSSSSGNTCSVYTSRSLAVPDGYGSPFNQLSIEKEPTLTVSCNSDGAIATAGSAPMYVYKDGFVARNGTWEAVNFSGLPATNNVGWFQGYSTATIPSPAVSGSSFVIAFICQYQGSNWKCGCRDSACTQNYWTIQGYGN